MRERESRLSPQPWPWIGPRVLVEQAAGDRADALVAVLRRAGYAVAVCPGPLAGGRCPLAGEEGCAAAEGADAVVSSLGLQTAEAREALAALRARLPRTPLLVEAGVEDVARWRELVEDCQIVAAPAVPEQLLEAVRAALAPEVSGVA